MIKWSSFRSKQHEAANPRRHRFGVVWQWRTLRTWILRRIALGKGAETGLIGVDRHQTGPKLALASSRFVQARLGLRYLLILFWRMA